ncbi:substrate-binding domain-containing protein [Micrococcaceae bacterium Sec5.7]
MSSPRHGGRASAYRRTSLVGFDGTYQAEESVPPLTSVSQPLQEMGRAALRFVLRQARGDVLDSRRVELATRLVIRESTAPPREINAPPRDAAGEARS